MKRALALLALLAAAAPGATSATETVRVATLAPKQSVLGKVLSAWAKAASEKSGGALDLSFYWNGTQGDEGTVVAKMKSGQLDAAVLSSLGLSKIHKPILALQIPGLLPTWDKLDKARDALRPDFEKGAKAEGFTILGWGDLGLVRTMTKGFALRAPDDLKGKKVAVWREDVIGPVVHALVGITPVPVSPAEVLPSLLSGAIAALNAPALVAEQLQWAPKLDHISDTPFTAAVGGMVMRTKKLDGMAADQRTIFLDTGKAAAAAVGKRARDEDAESFKRLKAKMTVVTPDVAKWTPVLKAAKAKLSGGTFPADVIAKIEKAAR